MYLNQIKKLLLEFEIETSKPVGTTFFVDRKRDDIKTQTFRFFIRGNIINALKLYNNIVFLYAKNKQTTFDKIIQNTKPNLRKELKKCNLYHKSLKLRKTGIGSILIAKRLNISETMVRHWIYTDAKPRLIDKEKEMLRLIQTAK